MKTHIAETLKEIDHRIDELTLLRRQIIVNFGPPAAAAPVAITPAPACRPARKAATVRPAKAAKAKPARQARAGSVINDPGVIAQIRKLAEPFTCEVLVANGICQNAKSAYNLLYRAAQAGWLTKVGRGEFTRAKQFGGPQATLDAIHQEITPA
jgi:hypothetical protein